jgi:AraC family transcriptional regulator
LVPPIRAALRSYRSEPRSETHSHLQLVLPCRGRLHMRIGDVDGYAGDDRCAIVPRGVDHAYFADVPNRLIVVDLDEPIGVGCGAVFVESTPATRAAAALLLAEARRGGLDDPLVADALRSYVARSLLGAGASASGQAPDKPALRRALAFIHASYAQPIDLAAIGAAADASESTLRRAFVAAFGLSPVRYAQRIRLERAREMLLSTGDSISAIAVQTGFCDQSHLTRLFRREFGATPGRLRTEMAATSKCAPELCKTVESRPE